MTALPFRDGLGVVHLIGVRVGQDAAETPRQRLTRLEREWDNASDAAHLLWAYDTPTPASAEEIRANYDRVTSELRSVREWLEIEERLVRL